MNDRDKILQAFPPLLRHLAEAASIETAWALGKAWGGQRRAIPKRPTAKSPLTQAVGFKAARQIAAFRGGEKIYIPQLPQVSKKQLILEMSGPTNQVASLANCSARYVEMVRASVRPEPAR
ncbi:MAG: hypothetical protein GC191_20640 [Azospirillum sp.]|nr:hypothetical protein [Azospirillum sp.]